jgi:hypothetical protein
MHLTDILSFFQEKIPSQWRFASIDASLCQLFVLDQKACGKKETIKMPVPASEQRE